MILSIILIALGIYVIKTSIGAIFKIGICLAIIAMILNMIGQVIYTYDKIVYLEDYKKKNKFKLFIKKVKKAIRYIMYEI